MADDMETMDAGTPRQPPHMMDEGSTDEGTAVEIVDTVAEEQDENEDSLIQKLGITPMVEPSSPDAMPTEEPVAYDVVPNPDADEVDLSELRGTRAPKAATERHVSPKEEESSDELEALAELVPELKARSRGPSGEGHTMTIEEPVVNTPEEHDSDEDPVKDPDREVLSEREVLSHADGEEEEGVEVEATEEEESKNVRSVRPTKSGVSSYSTKVHTSVVSNDTSTKNPPLESKESMQDSMQVQQSADDADEEKLDSKPVVKAAAAQKAASLPSTDKNRFDQDGNFDDEDQNLGGFDDIDSENAIDSDAGDRLGDDIKGVHSDVKPSEKFGVISSSASLSTATQTHEVRMPMYLPTFKPATGCTNASDFIVRCFVARLRSGITVVKHGRSRWCKSRLRILHIHPDGRSLSWKPAVGEPTTSKRPPKLDLSTCMEVRHAWSPDPLNPMFTGTMILRQKCEAANAHKSFALIFPKRTVDITAVTADQCKVLMEGFSALCFRLQVANLAGRGSKKGKENRSSGDEEEVATTASVTLTNNSTQLQLSPSGSGAGARSSKRNSHR